MPAAKTAATHTKSAMARRIDRKVINIRYALPIRERIAYIGTIEASRRMMLRLTPHVETSESPEAPKVMSVIERIQSFHSELTEIRRDIHAHPEIAFEEVRTSDLVAGRLESLGIEVHRGLGRTGVVGTLEGRPRQPGDRA